MARKSDWIGATIIVVGAGLLALPAQAQSIGQAEQIMLYAYGTKPNQARQPLFQFEQVVANEVIETVDRGGALIRLRDETEFTVGPASTVTLDQFVYDPATSAGNMAIKLGVGTFRYVSGRMAKDGVRIRSDIATIGVRGTTLGLSVAPSLITVIAVVVGQAAVTPNGGQTVVVNEGQTATVSPDGSVAVAASSAPAGADPMQPGPSPSDAGQSESPSSSSSSSSSSSGS